MYKKILLITIALVIFFAYSYAAEVPQETQAPAAAQEAQAPVAMQAGGITKEKIIEIASMAVKEKGVKLEEANVIYDEDGKLWSEKVGYLATEETSPNHGILRRGFLNNYRIVYFDLKEPLKDIWVFIDKDSGEIFEVYTEQ